ncbi:hypothetical protein DM860_011434 [Cuscuta australis]|uniref:Uncharacterized protein n=1 Tax=Cuscuta australis TaxID=267555 RepID=A0A328DTZ4_9ASTE|nr:hypothetical protein DM860_011434 [Cuscuta australis]
MARKRGRPRKKAMEMQSTPKSMTTVITEQSADDARSKLQEMNSIPNTPIEVFRRTLANTEILEGEGSNKTLETKGKKPSYAEVVEGKDKIDYELTFIQSEEINGQCVAKMLKEDLIEDLEGRVISQSVEYEWRPTICARCNRMGHTGYECRKKQEDKKGKGPIKKVWRPKQKQVEEPEQKQEEEPEPEERENKEEMEDVQEKEAVDQGDGFQKTTNVECHPMGRIWVAWNKKKVQVHIMDRTAQTIHCKARELDNKEYFWITFVYGFNDQSSRRLLWENLRRYSQHMREAWCCIGDYNSVLEAKDRKGGNLVTEDEMKDFKECVLECGLEEAVQQDKFKFHPKCAGLKIVNLCFADDLIVVSRADEKSTACIMKVLDNFQLETGLSINITKSQIVFGGVNQQIKEKLLKQTGDKNDTKLERYSLECHNPSQNAVCDMVVDEGEITNKGEISQIS